MSLHRIYHPPNVFSAADKQGLAEHITALYTAIGLPAFYVNVIFVSTEANSFFVGGQAKDKYIQIVIQHLAAQLQNDETKKIIMGKYEKAISPFIKEKGYDWETHIEEISNGTWRLNGLTPPSPNSSTEKDWMNLPQIGKLAPIFKEKAVLNNKVCDISSSDFNDKYVILLFFPMDFTYGCSAELIAFSNLVDEFSKLNTSIIACATESHFTYLKCLNMPFKEGSTHNLRIPLMADKSMAIAKKFGVLNEEEGIAYRAMFIIDNNGILRQITINDCHVSRSAPEARRLIEAIQHSEKSHPNTSKAGFIKGLSSDFDKSRSRTCLEKAILRELIE